jgi:SAM-dependent methyltransferase
VVQDPFFTRFFTDTGWDAIAAYHVELQSRLPQAGRVLDLGCGSNAQLAPYRTPRREVWGVDFHPHPRLEHGAWFRSLAPDGGIPFPARTFDVVACSWVLEHVAAPARFLHEVSRVLRPGGCLVALTPHGVHYAACMIRLLDLLPHSITQGLVRLLYGRPQHDTFPTQYRLNTLAQLRRAARAAGMGITAVARYPNQGYFSFWEPLRRAAIVTDWALDRLRPGLGRLYLVATLHKGAAAARQPGVSGGGLDKVA